MIKAMPKTIYIPMDHCPDCGTSIYGKSMELVSHKAGNVSGGWAMYCCKRCGLVWRMFVPGMTATNVRKWSLQVMGYFGGA